MKVNYNQNDENANLQQDINNILKTALEFANKTDRISVNIVDISPEEICELNKKYRGVDRVTDVLSFPMIEDFNKIEEEPDYILGECNIGDIYINPQRAREQAEEYGHSFQREYCFLVLHGFLHLLGYDHIKKDDEKVMTGLQNRVMEHVNIRRG